MRFGDLCVQCVLVVFPYDFDNFCVFHWLLFLVSFLEHGLFKSIVFSKCFGYYFEHVCFAHSPQKCPLGTTTTTTTTATTTTTTTTTISATIIIIYIVTIITTTINYWYHYWPSADRLTSAYDTCVSVVYVCVRGAAPC